ncbi:DoxX family membrane protein [Candidatus Marinimicrobia bacterium]|nr:DoxX family membrane protein [Candidatus Neomarinimicrobiota bacterium]
MNKIHPVIVLCMRVVLGIVFLVASYQKILDPQQFAREISNYHFIPLGLENVVAIILPWIEVFIGLGLILGIMIDGSSLISGVLLIMFNLLVIQAMIRGFNIECGCGLKEGQMVGWQKLMENMTLLITSYIIFNQKNRSFQLSPKTSLSE